MLAFAATALALAGLATAAPTTAQDLSVRAPEITDTQILQYALTLEHLEETFYREALAKYDAKAFAKAGFPSWVRGRFQQIASHESSHVDFLTDVLATEAVPACKYSFPYTDVRSFATLSQALEGVGTSAYLGAASLITDKNVLTAAGSILTTEARHDAWVAAAVNKGAAWNTPYDTPLSLSGVFSLAMQFITSCPTGYPSLPVTTYPALKLSTATPKVGTSIDVTFENKSSISALYLAFYSGVSVYHSEIRSGKALVPTELKFSGTVYAAVVSSDSGARSDSTTLSGLAILQFPFKASDAQSV